LINRFQKARAPPMTTFLNHVQRLLTWAMAFAVAILLVPVSLQIFSRYTNIIPSYIWTEEMSRFFFIWMVMLGATLAVRERLHFDVDIWTSLSPRQDAGLRMVANFFVLLFTGVMIWQGIDFTRFGWNQTSELADLPMWLIFIAWPFAGVIWLLFLIEAFARDIDLYRRGESLVRIVSQEAV
jgi:TRAP-type C4-dicarboxylate transport system permease small subunit